MIRCPEKEEEGYSVIEVNNLVKKYGDKIAINGLNFNIATGEIVGLLGLNGAGKSTTMNCLTGYIAPTAGTIRIDGHDILKEPDEAKRMIGYLPEVFSFYTDMKILEYLNFICDLKGVLKDKKFRAEHIEKICRQVGIWDISGRMIRNLSKGYKQRVGFAQAMIGNPRVLILDEPTVGLDPSQIIEIRQLIKDSGKDSTVIVSSHILSEIQAICSRIIIIHEGKIAADGSPSELTSAMQQNHEVLIRVKGDDQQITKVLQQRPEVYKLTHLPSKEEGAQDYQVEGPVDTDMREILFRTLSDAGFTILQITGKEASLENLFLKLTSQQEI